MIKTQVATGSGHENDGVEISSTMQKRNKGYGVHTEASSKQLGEGLALSNRSNPISEHIHVEKDGKDENAMICPNCEKNFASQQGLSYHLSEFQFQYLSIYEHKQYMNFVQIISISAIFILDKKVCQQTISHGIYLSLRNDDYKAIMFEKFRKIELGLSKERMTDIAIDLFHMFKKQKKGGSFFKFNQCSSQWVEVDDVTALRSK